VGELTASIAHEVNQPVAEVVTNAEAALRWLGPESPNLNKVREVLGQIVKDGMRAGDVIHGIRALIKKAPPRMARVVINETVLDVITLTRSELPRHGVSLQTEIATGLPSIDGDLVQLQQVMLNLILNAAEAMRGIDEGVREMRISTGREASNVSSSACGIPARDSSRRMRKAFSRPFTQPSPTAWAWAWQSVVRSSTANEPRGAVFQFTLPLERDESIPAQHVRPKPAA
jgi:C4-dicarboxylate-specific signal transduction histidine kinase